MGAQNPLTFSSTNMVIQFIKLFVARENRSHLIPVVPRPAVAMGNMQLIFG